MQDWTAKLVSRDQILRREWGQGNIHSLCLADHEQVWQSYPVDPYSDDYTYNNMFVRLGTNYEIRWGYFESIKNSANQFISKP